MHSNASSIVQPIDRKNHISGRLNIRAPSLIREGVRFAVALLLALLYPVSAHAETLVIPGSGNPEYILGELAKAFNSQQKLHTVTIPTTIGTAGAFREISEGNTTLARVGRPLTEEERKQGLTFQSLGRDPVVFVGGTGVTIQNITADQALSIFTGRLTNWQELGGKPASIRAIGREGTDASFRGIARALKNFAGIRYAEAIKVVHLDSHLLELLDRFPGSFGYLNRSALSAARTKLVLLALDGIEPSPENLESGKYPLWIETGLIYRANQLSAGGRAFLDFISSPAGTKILQSHGLTPVVPDTTGARRSQAQ